MSSKRKSDTKDPKPTKKPSKQQSETQYSICIPSTIISASNATNLEQVTSIAYQVAKALTIYNIGEVVLLEISETPEAIVENGATAGSKKIRFNMEEDPVIGNEKPKTKFSEESMLFATLLQYFVTPPYLVKSVFKNSNVSKKFQYASKLPKLSTLPFMNNNEVLKHFREGITISKKSPKAKKGKKSKKLSSTKYVNIGDSEPLELVGQEVPVGVRVTIDIVNKQVVSPLDAYGIIGSKSSFGYHVRLAKTFSSVFTESAVAEGYSSSIYVNSSDHFDTDKYEIKEITSADVASGHHLLVISSWKDLDYSFQKDKVSLEGVSSAGQMFDGELSIPKGVRMEDATLIALSKLS